MILHYHGLTLTQNSTIEKPLICCGFYTLAWFWGMCYLCSDCSAATFAIVNWKSQLMQQISNISSSFVRSWIFAEVVLHRFNKMLPKTRHLFLIVSKHLVSVNFALKLSLPPHKNFNQKWNFWRVFITAWESKLMYILFIL